MENKNESRKDGRNAGEKRILFNDREKEYLNGSFDMNPNPTMAERERLAKKLGRPIEKISNWFSNQRNKRKRFNDQNTSKDDLKAHEKRVKKEPPKCNNKHIPIGLPINESSPKPFFAEKQKQHQSQPTARETGQNMIKDISQILNENEALKKENEMLVSANEKTYDHYYKRMDDYAKLKEENQKLRAENESLKEENEKLKRIKKKYKESLKAPSVKDEQKEVNAQVVRSKFTLHDAIAVITF